LVLGEFDKYRRQCQWRKNDLEAKSSRLAAYELFYRPKDQDELDVVNFSSQNNCLLMKHLHRFYNRASLPWIKLIWGYITIIPYHLQSLEMSCIGERIVSSVWGLSKRKHTFDPMCICSYHRKKYFEVSKHPNKNLACTYRYSTYTCQLSWIID
jgi:hypothetical protein